MGLRNGREGMKDGTKKRRGNQDEGLCSPTHLVGLPWEETGATYWDGPSLFIRSPFGRAGEKWGGGFLVKRRPPTQSTEPSQLASTFMKMTSTSSSESSPRIFLIALRNRSMSRPNQEPKREAICGETFSQALETPRIGGEGGFLGLSRTGRRSQVVTSL